MGVCGTPWRIVDVIDVWPRIAKRVPAGSYAVDIIVDCLHGEAVCMESEDGVLVITVTPGRTPLHFTLFVLLCVGYSAGAYQRREPDLDALAADLGASSIAMFPRRRGWDKLLRGRWVKQGELFTREVDYGRQATRTEADSRAESAG